MQGTDLSSCFGGCFGASFDGCFGGSGCACGRSTDIKS